MIIEICIPDIPTEDAAELEKGKWLLDYRKGEYHMFKQGLVTGFSINLIDSTLEVGKWYYIKNPPCGKGYDLP